MASDENKLSPDSITPVSSGEISAGKEWLRSKLKKEIHKGSNLRNIKTTIPRQLDELRTLEVKPYNSPKNRIKKTVKQNISKKIPSISSNRSGNRNKLYRKQRQCSTRIMELAAPTKRRCIATWRHKSNNLPPLMLERLKKYINGELPVTNISEAATCFDRNKTIKSTKRIKTKTYIVTKDRQEIRKLCGTFGGIIAQKLLAPINISLDDSLKRVSNIVNKDITKLMKKNIKQNNFSKKINEEISNKVTLWLTDILEISENVQLERDLKDLDEEEGPAIDFVEDLIEQAVDMCKKLIEDQNEHKEQSITEDTSFEPNKSNKDIDSASIIVKEENLSEHEMNSSINGYVEETIGEILNIEGSNKNMFEQNEKGTKVGAKNSTTFKNSDSIVSYKIDEVTPLEKNENHERKINVRKVADSPILKPILSHSSANIVLDTKKKPLLEASSSSSITLNHMPIVTPSMSESLASIQRKKIKFSAPKPQLLTDADENWPDDIALPTLRISQSAHKSVSSLGNIYEKDD